MSNPLLPAMTGAEMQCTREFMGLTRDWLAEDLQIAPRNLMRMEADKLRIPDAVVSRLDEIATEAKRTTTDLVAQYRRKMRRAGADEDVFITTYKTDEAYAELPDWPGYPAKWHRMVCARVCEAVEGLIIAYADTEAVGPREPSFADALFSEGKPTKPVVATG